MGNSIFTFNGFARYITSTARDFNTNSCSATGEGEDIIGDPPADRVYFALKDIVEFCKEQKCDKPTLQQLLDGIFCVLRDEMKELVNDAPQGQSLKRLVADVAPDDIIISSTQDNNCDAAMLNILKERLENITVAYECVVERKPSLRELLASLSFGLSGNCLDDYLSVDEDTYVKQIVPEF